jgi:hypothetical protein
MEQMDEHEWLAERFEAHRAHLRTAAYRMPGSLAEADDAVQDTWLRLSRVGADDARMVGRSGRDRDATLIAVGDDLLALPGERWSSLGEGACACRCPGRWPASTGACRTS